MIHLANQRDPGTKDDRAHGGAEIGEDRLPGAGEPGAETMGSRMPANRMARRSRRAISIQCAATNARNAAAIKRPPTMATTTAMLMPGASGGSATRMAAEPQA